MNFIQIVFSLLVTSIIVYGSVINFFEKYIPQVLSQTFRYGKFSAKGKKSKLAIQVPKSWFKHFYVVAVIIYSYMLILVAAVYIFNISVPNYLKYILNVICGKGRSAHTPKNIIFIVVCLFTLQVYRRFYDTHFVSIFGKNSKMNLFHYIVGHVHYPGTAFAILCEAPIFTESSSSIADAPFKLFDITLSEIFVIVVFLLAWRHQQICTRILAELRMNHAGKVVTNEYKLPEGDWFKYLTAPHQTTEILMYTSVMWLLWHNITWFFIFIWVLANQVETVLLSHWWYQDNFKNFPKSRKALIPFIY